MANPICPACGVAKAPWGLNNWKCPKCGAIGSVDKHTVETLAKRVEVLEEKVASLLARRERVA